MKILVFPYDKNPYQNLLYKAMKEEFPDLKVTYFRRLPFIGALAFPAFAVVVRVFGYQIIHIHWPAFSIGGKHSVFKKFSYLFFKLCMSTLKLTGYRIVWTVHNVLPHEPQTSNDLLLMQELSRSANAKIVHSSYTVNQMKIRELSIDNIVVIPHGNYINVYPDTISEAAAREKLNLASDEFVILFFGLIRQYKGVDSLLEATKELSQKYSKLRVLIAGKCLDPEIEALIGNAGKEFNVSFHNGYVPNEDVATYFKAADLVCLPFKSITTSGSTLLALSFGKPLIAPRSGALTDLPENVGFLYNIAEASELKKALMNALDNKALTQEQGRNAAQYAKMLSWDKIANLTYKVYLSVLENIKKS